MLDIARYKLIFLANNSAMQGHISNSLGCFSFLSGPLANSCEVTDLFTLVAFSSRGRAFLSYMAMACSPTEFAPLHWIRLGLTALLFRGRAMSCINGRTTACQLVLHFRLANCVDGNLKLFPCQSHLCLFRKLHRFTDCNNSLQLRSLTEILLERAVVSLCLQARR